MPKEGMHISVPKPKPKTPKLYEFEDAYRRGICKDAILVGIQAKNTPIHQGHIELIEFAHTLGRVVVQINMNSLEYIGFLATGEKRTSVKEDIGLEVASIGEVGVSDIVLKRHEVDSISESEREDRKARADRVLQVLKNVYISDTRMNQCRIRFMQYHDSMKRIPRGQLPKIAVLGPELENFFVKAALKHIASLGHPVVDQIVIFPKVVKDEYGLRFRTSYPKVIGADEIDLLRTLPPKVDQLRKDFHIGTNPEVVIRENALLPKDSKWRYWEIIIYEGEFFGNGRLESVTFGLQIENGIHLIEEISYVK